MDENNNNNNQELDDILNLVKEWQSREEYQDTPAEAPAPEAAPQPVEEVLAPPVRNERQQAQASKKPKKEKLPKVKKEKALKPPKPAKAAKEKKSAKPGALTLKKKVVLVLVAIALLVGGIFGGIGIYRYQQTAYLRPYIKKYSVTYPKGILEEYCDAYGRNISTAGELIVKDVNYQNYYYANVASYPKLAKGVDVYQEQQFRSMEVEKALCDLESIYATKEGYAASTQEFACNTIFEKADYRVVAAFYTNNNPEDDAGYRFPYNLYGNMTQKSFKNFVDRVSSRMLYETGYKFDAKNQYVLLSVESDFMENFRFVIVGARITDGVPAKLQPSAKKKVHYPQVWYDKNKKQNPYRFASDWYPEIIDETGKKVQLTADDFAE